MNYNKTFVFVAKAGQSLKTSGLSSTLADGQLGILNKSMTCVNAAPTYSASNYVHIALGNSDVTLPTFKSPAINPKKVTKYFGYAATSASTSQQVQITYVGFDETDDTKSPTLDCKTSYGVGIRIWETYNDAMVNPLGMTRTVVLDTDCCEDCAGCGSVNCGSFFAKLADKINADSFLSKFVTATAVGKPSAPTSTSVFSLTIPDPGDGTATTAVLTSLQTLYADYVTTAGTDIVITADTDGDSDADSLGTTRFELTPKAGVSLGDLPPYEGVLWEATTAATTNTACGLKIEGKVLDLEYNACVPEAWNYAPRTVRFKVFAGENPEQIQDADVNWSCSPWAVTTTQEVTFPYGAGYLIAEMERENYRYHMPNKARFYDPVFNEVTLNANVADTYYLYYIESEDNYSYASHQDASQDKSLTIVAIPYNGGSGTAVADAFETILDSYITTSNTAFAAVNIA